MTIVMVEKSATETAGKPHQGFDSNLLSYGPRLARMRGTPCSTFLNPRDLIFVKSAPLTHLALLFTSYQIYALQLPSLEHFWKQYATLLDSPQRHWQLPSISPCRLHCGGACRALQQPPAARATPTSRWPVAPKTGETHIRRNMGSTDPNGGGNANGDVGFGANGYSFIPYDQPFPQLSRKIKACTVCRRQKVRPLSRPPHDAAREHHELTLCPAQIKCLMDDAGPPCRRCAERNLDCILGKNLQTIIDEKSQYVAS